MFYSTAALAALVGATFTTGAPVDIFNPHYVQCLSPVFSGTPPNIKATQTMDVPSLMLDDSDPNTPGAKAILSPNGMSSRLDLSNGHVAAYIGGCTPYFLNVEANNASYKPLVWSYERNDNTWDAAYAQPLKAAAENGSGDFLACRETGSNAANFDLYLQTGSDVVVGAECFTIQLVISENTLHPVGSGQNKPAQSA